MTALEMQGNMDGWEEIQAMPAGELHGLESAAMEQVTFGIDSDAAVTVAGPKIAAEYPRMFQGKLKKMTDCQGNAVADLGEKDLAFDDGRFARVTVAPVAKNLMAVSALLATGHEVIFRPPAAGGSFIKHMQTGKVKQMTGKNGVFEATFRLHPYAGRRMPPPRGGGH